MRATIKHASFRFLSNVGVVKKAALSRFMIHFLQLFHSLAPGVRMNVDGIAYALCVE